MRLSYRLSLCLATLLVVCAAMRGEAATSLSIAWDQNPEPEIAGYVVHVGTMPGVLTQTIDVGAATTFLYEPIVPGQQYCFAVSAYFDGPVHGPSSAEVCGYGDQAPLLMAPGNQSSVIGQPDALQLQGSDPDGLPVSYSITPLPAGLSLMPSTGFISGTPTTAQTVNVTATVSDGVLSTSRSFRWTVQPPMAFAGLTADRSAPQPANSPITFTASATGGSTPYQYRWWLHDGTSWQMLRDWTTSSTFTWVPAAANPAYRITVWIKDANSTTTTWDVSGSMAFPITVPLQVTLSADRVAPQMQGSSITFTAAAAGGRSPYQYRWWVYDGTSWQMLRDWTTASTFTWTPVTANAGYRITVWVKSADSTTTTWDGYASMAFPIEPPVQVMLAADRVAPQRAGSPITFTPLASGGKAPYVHLHLDTDDGRRCVSHHRMGQERRLGDDCLGRQRLDAVRDSVADPIPMLRFTA